MLLQLLAGLKNRNPLGWHLDLGAGFRIAPRTPPALASAEAAEAPDLDAIASLQRADYALENSFHNGRKTGLCECGTSQRGAESHIPISGLHRPYPPSGVLKRAPAVSHRPDEASGIIGRWQFVFLASENSCLHKPRAIYGATEITGLTGRGFEADVRTAIRKVFTGQAFRTTLG